MFARTRLLWRGRAPFQRAPSRSSSTTPPPTARAAATAGAVGFGAGALGACAGVGGSLFVIPGLVRFAGVPQSVAAGNSLIAVTCIAVTSAASYAAADAVDIPMAASLSIAAAAASPVGALLSRRVDKAVLRRALAILCLTMAPSVPLRARLLERRAAKASELDAPVSATSSVGATDVDTSVVTGASASDSVVVASASASNGAPVRTATLASAGAAIGFTSGMLGVGGGGFFTAAMAALSDAPLRVVIGTSLSAMVLPSAAAAITYVRMGQVSAALVPPLVVGSVGGAAVGSRVALSAPEHVLQWGFALMLAVLGVRMYRAPFKPRMPVGSVMRGTKGGGG